MALNRDRVLHAAVALADDNGIDALSMRNLAQELGVVPMALYKHVANKEQLLDGMVDAIVAEIDPPATDGTDWKPAVRQRILSARKVLLRHPWASRVIESRATPTPAVLDYINSLIGMFLAGGFSLPLTHQVMHTLGSRMWGFTQELFPSPPVTDPEAAAAAMAMLGARWPHIVQIATAGAHTEGGLIVGGGCDDQFEFEFALDLLLDGFDRLHREGWAATSR